MSASRPLVYGVPQGSVLGPVLFTLYSQPLSDVISDHDCDYHKYADDTELSKGASPDQFDSVQSCIQTCIGDVLIWMNSNKLKLNTDKTEVMPVGSASRVALVESECANIGGNSVPFKMSVKYLGVHLDQTLSMRQHIDSVCRASFLELRRAATIRPYLSQSATARLVAAMIISRLDYCNSVFAGLPADQVARLQRIQNNAARLVMKKRKRDHVTPLLKELHWLPVKFRCQYKIATLAYRHFEGSLPPYLSSSLCTYEPSRSLRSSKEKLLKIPKRNLKSFGERSFSFMAPSVWNSLPADLRNLPTLSQFKSNLKTFLFTQAFPQI
ncbi:reverse transcriptase domain-containing protein [Thiolapillus sp.]|uniref:reverse transcriptase domain-containing protein n=1 Tax=Thiolapillus sp. TaxID=2017437 RepID=UPI003AF92D59